MPFLLYLKNSFLVLYLFKLLESSNHGSNCRNFQFQTSSMVLTISNFRFNFSVIFVHLFIYLLINLFVYLLLIDSFIHFLICLCIQVCDYCVDVLKALDVKWGPTHTEVMATADGPRSVNFPRYSSQPSFFFNILFSFHIFSGIFSHILMNMII